jgi:hypothetical protein
VRGHKTVSERYGFGDEWLFEPSGTAYMTVAAVAGL